jgi:hypothetical protein
MGLADPGILRLFSGYPKNDPIAVTQNAFSS